VSSFEGVGGRHGGEFFDESAGGTFNEDLTMIANWIIVDPGEVEGVFQALLNWASTVNAMLVAPLLVPVLYVISIWAPIGAGMLSRVAPTTEKVLAMNPLLAGAAPGKGYRFPELSSDQRLTIS